MLAILLSAAVVCFAVLFLGQAALRLCGAEGWSWLAPSVGLAVAVLVASPALYLPGRAATMAVVLLLLVVAAAVWCLRTPAHRPPLIDLLAALPVALLAAIPFLAAGHGGIMGVTVNNDMAPHLTFAEGIVSAAAEAAGAVPSDYPLGPHSVAAALSEGLGIHLELAFSGLTVALPAIAAWTALMAAREARWFAKPIVATVVGLPYLVAAYYGEGAFKEIGQTAFVLAFVLVLAGFGPRLARWRWVPVALLVGGIVSVYSPAGLLWPLAITAVWLLGLLVTEARAGRLSKSRVVVRRELPALGVGLAVLVLALLPQVERMWNFIALRDSTGGIPVDSLGNLVGPLPWWEVLGTWNNPDFRLPASAEFTGGIWSIFVLALICVGTIWAFRRGRWMLPLAAATTMAIWWLSEQSQSPYVTAKALVIASPLLLLLAVFPLTEPGGGRASGRLRWPWLALLLLGIVLFLRVGRDDVRALRWSPVGPADQARQLETFRPLTGGQPTLFLGADEFINWELAGAPVKPFALASLPVLPQRPQKDWEIGEAIDFDSVPASVLNEYEWIVAYRDAAASVPPPQLRLARATRDYELWKRTATIPERSILREGEWPGAVLDCDTPKGRAIATAGGVAAIRRPPLVVPLSGAPAGETVTLRLRLPAGRWELQMPYISPYPIEVRAPGLRTTLPATLSRIGPRLPVGRVTLRRETVLPISFHVEDTKLAPPTAGAFIKQLVVTPLGSERIVPVERACGRYVDWYRSALG